MTVRIPVVSLCEIDAWLQYDGASKPGAAWPGGCVSVPGSPPAGSYAVRVEETGLTPHEGWALAVFSRHPEHATALEQTFLVKRRGGEPLVRRVLRREADGRERGADFPLAAREIRRKSFMTPTPLHVPGSRISPIPGYTHASLYLKPPDDPAGVEVWPLRDVLWLHPLVMFLPNAPG